MQRDTLTQEPYRSEVRPQQEEDTIDLLELCMGLLDHWKFIAAAAAAGVTFTVPEVTQSLIITRMEGRTPVPEREALHLLAAHGTSMAIYLSAGACEDLQAKLLAHTPPDTPVLCAYRVGWPEQRLIWATAGTLAHCVHEHGLVRQTVFLVLPGQNAADTASLLYAANFSHGYRQADES